jgi:hypothetical protein
MYVDLCIYTLCVYIHTYVHIYIHTYIYIYIYIYTTVVRRDMITTTSVPLLCAFVRVYLCMQMNTDA